MQKQSGLGIASFVISLAMLVSIMATVVVIGYLEETTPGGLPEDGAAFLLLTALYFGSLVVALVGAILGLAGVLQSDRRRLFAALGLALNLFVLTFGASILVLGAMVE